MSRAADAWSKASTLDEEIGDVIDCIPSQPTAELSAQQLETAASHLAAAKRLLIEVEKRECAICEEETA